tara:strand:- start:484 stop:669 length:186 start_codon:yes stop_codon:yes gene_type:complete
MCLVCIEYSKGKLLPEEGLRNLKEMKPSMEEDHYWEVHAKLTEDLDEQELDEWWEETGFGD